MPQQCSECYFSRVEADALRHCHYRAPQQHWRKSGVEAWWPVVEDADWCGNFLPPGVDEHYIQGNLETSNMDRLPLLVSNDPNTPVIALKSIQVTNDQQVANAVLVLFDGDTDVALASVGCPNLQTQAFTYEPSIRTSAGQNLYCGLVGLGGPVYVSAQGYEFPVGYGGYAHLREEA